METALIFAGGVEEGALAFPPGSHLIVCADSGYRLCRRCQLKPDMVIGDFDSLSKLELQEIGEQGIRVEQWAAEKDESDLELALLWAHRHGVKEMWLYGLLGGRLDHCLFNLVSVLSLALDLGIRATAVSSQGEFWVAERSRTILNRRGWTCSLLPLEAEVQGVTLVGFQYPLTRETLRQTRTRSLSNRLDSDRATLEVDQGRLLVMLIPEEARCSTN